jgi:hypothetical protein
VRWLWPRRPRKSKRNRPREASSPTPRHPPFSVAAVGQRREVVIRGEEPQEEAQGRGEGPEYVFQANRLIAEAATKPPRKNTSSEDGDVKARAYDEGSDGDEAAASAARHAHAASVAAADNKAAASAARHARAAIAARRTAKANKIDEGAHNKGSINDEAEASAVRRAYAASAASNDDKAAASAVKAGAYDKGSDGDEAAASAARRAYAASVAAEDDKAAASAARRARAAIAARCLSRMSKAKVSV